ncbi:MAG: hypothetical protein LBK75_08140 [Oscillospiraceae bacterium]|jgi:hypothetical protein|nr:hypothetical protein [Oscillospiraceae bacterium]
MRKNAVIAGVLSLAVALSCLTGLGVVPVMSAPETVAGGYVVDIDNVPSVYFERHKNWEALYNAAWQSHKSNIKKANTALNPEDVYYVDEAFDDTIFQWDTLFMMMFDKYGFAEFPTLSSMDNFYYHQIDSGAGLGYIPRRMSESNANAWHQYNNISGNNPPLFGWAEWEQYKVHGDASRFTKVINGKTILTRMDENFQYNKRQWRVTTGLYTSNGQGNGLDNTPNQGTGQSANDLSFQQYQYAYYIKLMAETVGNAETAARYEQEMTELYELLQTKMWSEEGSFFFNINQAGTAFTNIVTPTGLWALAAGAATPEQAERMIRLYARNSEKMFRPQGLSTVAYDYSSFKPTGGYWNGAMWSPTSYQYIKGLQRYGYDKLAFQEAVRHIDALERVRASGAYDRYNNYLYTLWENYSSEWDIPGSTESSDTQPSRSNFVGWTGALAIGSIIEDILGITLDAPRNTVSWNMLLTEGNGIDNLWMAGNTFSVRAQPRLTAESAVRITVSAQQPFTLNVKNGGAVQTFAVKAGENAFAVAGTDVGEGAYLSGKTAVLAGFDPAGAGEHILFTDTPNSAVTDGLKNQAGRNPDGSIYNINTIGYRNAAVRKSETLSSIVGTNSYEYVKKGVRDGFMVMTKAGTGIKTLRLALGIQNASAVISASLSDASAPEFSKTVSAGSAEKAFLVEIPYRAASDGNDLIVKYTITDGSGEVSLKSITLDDGGHCYPEIIKNITLTSGDGSLTVNADLNGVAYTGFNIYYGPDADNLTEKRFVSSLPAVISDLTNYQRCYVAVSGVINDVEGDMSDVRSETPESRRHSDRERAYDDWESVKDIVLNGNLGFDDIKTPLAFEGVVGKIYGSVLSFAVSKTVSNTGVMGNGAVVFPVKPQNDAATNITVTITYRDVTVTVVQRVVVKAIEPAERTYIYGRKGAASGSVNLTEEGSSDWVQFNSGSVTSPARKNTAAPLIGALQAVQTDGVANDCKFAFTWSDAKDSAPVSYRGLIVRGIGGEISFAVPVHSDKSQILTLYTAIWGGKLNVEFNVNGLTMYTDSVERDATSGLTGQAFEIEFKLSPSDQVTVRVYGSHNASTSWASSNILQAITLSETDVSPEPPSDVPDENLYIVSEAQPTSVNLTREGSKDWKLFNTTTLGNIEHKQNGTGIGNVAPLIGITKMNPNSGTATFSYTDGTRVPSGSHAQGVVFEKADNGLTFSAPYSETAQTLNVYIGAWSAKAEFRVDVIDSGGHVVKTASSHYDTGAQAGGTPAQYSVFRVGYTLEPAQSLTVTLVTTVAYDTTWGNISVSAITLGEAAHSIAVAPGIANGRIIAAPDTAEQGTEITVIAKPDDGYHLVEGSLQYTADGSADIAIVGDSFIMPNHNVTVSGVFEEDVKSISTDNRLVIKPISAPPGAAYSPQFAVKAMADIAFRLIVASYDANGRLLAVDVARHTLSAGDEVTAEASVAYASEAASYQFFFWDDGYKPLTDR